MSDISFPSPARRAGALILAAIVAVAVMLLLWWAQERFVDLTSTEPVGHIPLVPLLAFGLPIGSSVGIPLCLLIGMPLWHLALLFGWHGWREAAFCGVASGAIISGLWMILTGGPAMQLAWDDALPLLAGFGVAGACAGLVAHWVAYRN